MCIRRVWIVQGISINALAYPLYVIRQCLNRERLMICRSSSKGPHDNIPTNVEEVGIVITRKSLQHALDVAAFPTSKVVDFSGHSIFGRVVYVH